MTLDFYELTKGAPGYGNKAVPSLDFGALTLSDNLIQGKLHFCKRPYQIKDPWDGKRTTRIPTVKLKIPGKAFLKSESQTSVPFEL